MSYQTYTAGTNITLTSPLGAGTLAINASGGGGTGTFTNLIINGSQAALIELNGTQTARDGFNGQNSVLINTILNPTGGSPGISTGLSVLPNYIVTTGNTLAKAYGSYFQTQFNNFLAGTITEGISVIIDSNIAPSGGTLVAHTTLRVKKSQGATTNVTANFDVGVGIGANPDASAALDIQSTLLGVRFPNMTTTQKNAISSPAAGLVVFDTTLSKLCVYSGAAWQTITSV
jgi:hypothetical protein